ncbi:hypothetical protein IEO21_06803 [Rhodonia placenta]|uniref:Uncharacterized protein n=1 Tax=Rhodonia placenta TaxID=104341 RepID=A0A8H7NZA0_9APHY|nr:hypothetical protein IEO21_06803 [Postia placenta]
MNKTSTATVIYYLNRYIIIFMALVDAVGLADTAYTWSCENIELLYATLEIIWYGVWAAFSCLRVYAISGRDWRLAACALAFGLVPCGTNLVCDASSCAEQLTNEGSQFVTTQTEYSVSLTSFTGVCNTLVNLSTATSDK